jgi:F0F1-type ATP synthase assembly protein I
LDVFAPVSCQAFATSLRQAAHLYSDLFYSLTVGFVGAILFVLVDKYEPEGPLAHLLKFLVLFVAGVAILHRLQPYGLALF